MVTEPAILPVFRSDQLSSSLTVSFTLKPWFLKKTELSLASSPPLAAIRPAYPAYSLISIGTVLSLSVNGAAASSRGTSAL